MEILVAAGLLALLAAAGVAYRLNAGAADAREAARQEYHERLALLSARLRDDLRSAAAVRRTGEGAYLLTRLAPGGEGGPPLVRECAWEVSPGGGAVTRREAGASETYDFGPWLSGRPFILRIGE